jgi:hypothetical protein
MVAFLTFLVGCIVKLLGDASMLMKIHSSFNGVGPLQQSNNNNINNSSTIKEAMEDNNMINDHHHTTLLRRKLFIPQTKH